MNSWTCTKVHSNGNKYPKSTSQIKIKLCQMFLRQWISDLIPWIDRFWIRRPWLDSLIQNQSHGSPRRTQKRYRSRLAIAKVTWREPNLPRITLIPYSRTAGVQWGISFATVNWEDAEEPLPCAWKQMIRWNLPGQIKTSNSSSFTSISTAGPSRFAWPSGTPRYPTKTVE